MVWLFVDVMADDCAEENSFATDEEYEALPLAEKAINLMSPLEISSFMEDKGIPQEYCQVFEGI